MSTSMAMGPWSHESGQCGREDLLLASQARKMAWTGETEMEKLAWWLEDVLHS
jgi:hypothetical protein